MGDSKKTSWESPEDLYEDLDAISDFHPTSNGLVEAIDLETEPDVDPYQVKARETNCYAAIPDEYKEDAPDLNFQLPISGQGKQEPALDIEEQERLHHHTRQLMRLADESYGTEAAALLYYKKHQKMNAKKGRGKKASVKKNGTVMQHPQPEEKSTGQKSTSTTEGSHELPRATHTDEIRLGGKENQKRPRVNVAMQSIHLLYSNAASKSESSSQVLNGSKNSHKKAGSEGKAGNTNKSSFSNLGITDNVVSMRCQGKTAFEISRESNRDINLSSGEFDINNVSFPTL